MVFSIWVLYVTATPSKRADFPASKPTSLDRLVRCMFKESEGKVRATFPVSEFWLCRALMLVDKGVRGTLAVHCKTRLEGVGQIFLLGAVQVLLEVARRPKIQRRIEARIGTGPRVLTVAPTDEEVVGQPKPRRSCKPPRWRW